MMLVFLTVVLSSILMVQWLMKYNSMTFFLPHIFVSFLLPHTSNSIDSSTAGFNLLSPDRKAPKWAPCLQCFLIYNHLTQQGRESSKSKATTA